MTPTPTPPVAGMPEQYTPQPSWLDGGAEALAMVQEDEARAARAPTPPVAGDVQRQAFDAWWHDPKSADNTKSYSFRPSDIDEVRRLAADIAWKAWQAAASAAEPQRWSGEEAE